ncbi:MAG: tetratricopeptide repeat protein, partial [Deltaproteobacteria bacterium]|nr:tetratricopeptide repeat protein [Deltaproteobacteria bacterium]
RQPDEFISFSNKAWKWATNNAKGLAVGGAVFVLIFGAVTLWRNVVEKRAVEATDQLARALEMRDQMVIPNAAKVAKSDDGIPRFSTRKEKLAATHKELSKVAKERSGAMKQTALLLRASAEVDQGQYASAVKDYEAVLEREDHAELRRIAIEGLVYAHEGQKNWSKALDASKKLPQKKEARFRSIYHQARIMAAQGKKQEAKKLYKEIVDKAASRRLVDLAGQHMAVLQLK